MRKNGRNKKVPPVLTRKTTKRKEDENNGTEVPQTSIKPGDSRELLLYQKIDHLLSKYSLDNAFRDDVIMTEVLDVDNAIHQAFLTGRTPLIIDTSPDDKLSTYLSYQPNVVLLEVKTLSNLSPFDSLDPPFTTFPSPPPTCGAAGGKVTNATYPIKPIPIYYRPLLHHHSMAITPSLC